MRRVRTTKTCGVCRRIVERTGRVSSYKAERLAEISGTVVPAMQCPACQHWGMRFVVADLGWVAIKAPRVGIRRPADCWLLNPPEKGESKC